MMFFMTWVSSEYILIILIIALILSKSSSKNYFTALEFLSSMLRAARLLVSSSVLEL